MIAYGRKKSMEYVLLEAQEAAEQRVIIVLDELSCCWPVSRVQTSPDSTTNDSTDAIMTFPTLNQFQVQITL